MKKWILTLCLFPAAAFAGKTYQYAPIVQQDCSIEKLKHQLNEVYSHLMSHAFYDRSIPYLDIQINPLQATNAAAQNWKIDSLRAYQNEDRSGSCVGLARGFADELNVLLEVEFKLIPSTIPPSSMQLGFPEYPHAALFLKCQDGSILLDPGMNIPEPVYFSKENSSTLDLSYRGQFKYELNLTEEKATLTVIPNGNSAQTKTYSFALKELTNPDEAMVPQYIQADHFVQMCTLNPPSQDGYRIVINLRDKVIEATHTSPNGKADQLFLLSFSEYEAKPQVLEEKIAVIAEKMKVSKDKLVKRIARVLTLTQSEVSL